MQVVIMIMDLLIPTSKTCSILLVGFLYPVVTHWAWDANGWLFVGVDYIKDNVTMNITYQVSCYITAI